VTTGRINQVTILTTSLRAPPPLLLGEGANGRTEKTDATHGRGAQAT
jgi:hypothetical protein